MEKQCQPMLSVSHSYGQDQAKTPKKRNDNNEVGMFEADKVAMWNMLLYILVNRCSFRAYEEPTNTSGE